MPAPRVIRYTCAMRCAAVPSDSTASSSSASGIAQNLPATPVTSPPTISSAMRSGRSNQPTLQSRPRPSARARVYETMNDPMSASTLTIVTPAHVTGSISPRMITTARAGSTSPSPTCSTSAASFLQLPIRLVT